MNLKHKLNLLEKLKEEQETKEQKLRFGVNQDGLEILDIHSLENFVNLYQHQMKPNLII